MNRNIHNEIDDKSENDSIQICPSGVPSETDDGSVFTNESNASSKTGLTQPEQKMNWASVWVAAIILFLVCVQFSIYFASLWPYMSEIDKSADQTFYGITVAVYSIGPIVSSPTFGYMNKRWKKVRPVVALGVLFTIAGNILFMFVEAFPSNQKYVILVARFITGFGRGVAGPIRGYFATASTPEHKNRAVAIGTAAISLGLTAGPALQWCVTPIGYPAVVSWPFHINQYTAPAYISTAASLILLLLLLFVFKESSIGVDTRKKEDPYHYVPKYDTWAAYLCIFVWFAVYFCITNNEVVESPFTMAVFDWTSSDAVYYNSIIMTTSSFISFLIYIGYIIFGKKMNERVNIILGLCMLFGFYAITYAWPFYGGQLNFKSDPTVSPGNTTASTMLTSTIFNSTNDKYRDAGCDAHQEWCHFTPKLPLLVYLIVYPLLSMGLPVSTVSVSTIFSKIIGPRQQGFMQSIYAMAGNFSGLLGPVLTGFLFDIYGPRIAWTMTSAVVAIAVFATIASYHRLVPLNMRPKLQSGQKLKYDGGLLYHF